MSTDAGIKGLTVSQGGSDVRQMAAGSSGSLPCLPKTPKAEMAVRGKPEQPLADYKGDAELRHMAHVSGTLTDVSPPGNNSSKLQAMQLQHA